MRGHTDQLVGQSAEFVRVMHAARMVAVTDTSVLLFGEKGVGKSALAEEIHHISQRRGRPFIQLSCALDADTLAAQLSDLEQQAYEGGSLYLNEVAGLSSETQHRLAAFLEHQYRAGRQEEALRVIASSSTDLYEMMQRGSFREDLYYRLYIVPLTVPALRERTGDIALLIKHFTQELARQHSRKAPLYSVTVKNLLKRYRWPGNLRELRNFCERMVILSAGQTVQQEHLPVEISNHCEPSGKLGFVLPKEGISLSELETDVIRQALKLSGGNRSRAARLLGISRDTLLYRIQKYAITA